MELKKKSSTAVAGKPPHIVIVGAGISGLSAARRLCAAAAGAVQVTVLEGSHRIGGRIYTSNIAGEQVEIGATWIHGIQGSPLYEIAKDNEALEAGTLGDEHHWECMDGFPEPPTVKAQGGLTVDNAIVDPIAHLYKHLISEINDCRGLSLNIEDSDAGNLGTFLRRRLHKYLQHSSNQLLDSHAAKTVAQSGWDLKSIQEGVFEIQENWERCVTAAEDLNDLDLPAFNEYWEFPGEQITICKGFSSIVEALYRSLPPSTVKFNKKVKTIRWADDSAAEATNGYPVQVYCEDGSMVAADHVIVTVSLGVLKAKSSAEIPLFEPCLPSWKLEAIKKLGFGVVDKLFVLMEPKHRHPNLQLVHKHSETKNERGTTPWWIRKTHSMYPIHKKSNVLVSWFSGNEAKEMERLSDEEIATGIQRTLLSFGDDRLVAGLNHTPANGTLANSDNGYGVCVTHGRWNQNPLFLGSYSYIAVGSSGADIDVLADPLPSSKETKNKAPLQLLFAGEATHREQYSTTHGAYFSGLREADRLLKHYTIGLD